jgi:serine phosphatase RsbU (regulator of sigma subunit)
MQTLATEGMRRRVRILWVGYIAVLATIVIAVAPFAVLTRRAVAREEDELRPAEIAANQLESAAIDQETGQRGFIITRDPEFLGPYNDGRSDAAAAIEELRSRDIGPRAQRALSRTVTALERWQQETAQPEIEAAFSDPAIARDLVATGRGKERFEAFRDAHAALSDEIAERSRDARQDLSRLASFTLVALVASVATGVVLLLLLRRWSAAWAARAEHGAQELAHIATTLQHAILSTESVADARLEISAAYRPAFEALEVGGDWYDTLRFPDNRVGLVVGDVVGRGIPAAAVMGQLRSALAGIATAVGDPADVLEHLERFARTVPGAASTTCLVVVVDPEREELRFASAGHLPALFAAPDGTIEFLAQPQGAPLMAATGRDRDTGVRPFPVGATIVLFTDGLVERRREVIDEGLARLASVVAQRTFLPIERLRDEITTELVDPSRQRDDIALVVARLGGQEAAPAAAVAHSSGSTSSL